MVQQTGPDMAESLFVMAQTVSIAPLFAILWKVKLSVCLQKARLINKIKEFAKKFCVYSCLIFIVSLECPKTKCYTHEKLTPLQICIMIFSFSLFKVFNSELFWLVWSEHKCSWYRV
jgi:hypothetical protein